MTEIKKSNTSDHLANERTLLAWVRTSVGIMAFGFVVVKFSLFVRQLSVILEKTGPVPHKNYSTEMGISIVAVGAITLLLAFIRYKNTEKQINENNFSNSSTILLWLVVFLMLISLLLIVYLVKSTA